MSTAPSSPAASPVRKTATYSRITGPAVRKPRLTAWIERNYELVFAVVSGGGLLAIICAALVLAISLIG